MYLMLYELETMKVMKPLHFHRTGMHQYLQNSIEVGTSVHMPVKRCFELVEEADPTEVTLASHTEPAAG
jgi:hypothetical protein